MNKDYFKKVSDISVLDTLKFDDYSVVIVTVDTTNMPMHTCKEYFASIRDKMKKILPENVPFFIKPHSITFDIENNQEKVLDKN